MSSEPLVRLRLSDKHVSARSAWAEGLVVQLPSSVARLVREGADQNLLRNAATSAAEELRARAAFLAHPPASARLPIHYHTIPPALRRVLARGLGAVQRRRSSVWAHFPAWPLDLSADLCSDLGQSVQRAPAPTPVMLTHDLDSPEGLRNALSLFLPIEEQAGARSANYIVPCAWPVDEAIVSEIADRGHEVGVHGFDHANRTAFSEPRERRRRIDAGWTFGRRYDAKGYRAPSLVRNEALLADLSVHYAYDSSIPTSGGLFPTPNNGCASARPWKIGAIWELPLSLPRDGSLRFLGYSPEAIMKVWIDAADRVARSGGIVNLLTHCESGFSGNQAMLEIYRRFVEWIAASDKFRFILPRDLVGALDNQPVERNGD